MPPRKNPNIESITEEYIDGAVKVHVKASEVPPRQNLNISFADADKLGDEVTLSNQEAYEESHGKIYEMTHNNTVPWRNWAFYMILVSMLTVCFTFAKYASFASGDAQAAVASFNVSVNATKQIAEDTNITISTPAGKDITDTSNNTDIRIVMGDDNDSEKTVRFTISSSSDVAVKVTSVRWESTPAHNYKLSTAKTVGSDRNTLSESDFDKIYADGTNNNQYFDLTVYKAESSIADNVNLVITIEQVD